MLARAAADGAAAGTAAKAAVGAAGTPKKEDDAILLWASTCDAGLSATGDDFQNYI